MNGTNIRRAEVSDAGRIIEVRQASIRALCSNHYTMEQIERWSHRPPAAYEQDIRDHLVLVDELEGQIRGFGQMNQTDQETAGIEALYVHPDFARRNVGSLLLMFLQIAATDAGLPHMTLNSTLNAVGFWRGQGFAEIGPEPFPLSDGSSLDCVKMEKYLYQKVGFTNDQSVVERVLVSLRCEDPSSRMRALRSLKEQSPREVLDALVSLLTHPEGKICRRAGAGLNEFSKLHGEAVNAELKADELADYLVQGEEPPARLSCAIVLMSVNGTVVDQAFVRALQDSEQKIVQIACLEVGSRGGTEGTAALFQMLDQPNWRVRLEVCKALITQKTADQRVVSALEAMSQEPEAAVYDAEDEERGEFVEMFMESFGESDKAADRWGKLHTILARAREVAGGRG